MKVCHSLILVPRGYTQWLLVRFALFVGVDHCGFITYSLSGLFFPSWA